MAEQEGEEMGGGAHKTSGRQGAGRKPVRQGRRHRDAVLPSLVFPSPRAVRPA